MRTIPDETQKKAILKAFRTSEQMAQMTKDFISSFKLMEIQIDPKRPANDCYIFWSSMLSQTFRVPVREILIPAEK